MQITVPKERKRGVIDASFVLPVEMHDGVEVYPVKRNPKSPDQTPCYVRVDTRGHALSGTCPDWMYVGAKDGTRCKHMEVVEEAVLEKKRQRVLAPLDLPTYPIYHCMPLGERSLPEVEWLLAHGSLQNDFAGDAFHALSHSDGSYHLTLQTLHRLRCELPPTHLRANASLRELLLWCRRDRLLRSVLASLPTWRWYQRLD